MSFPAPIVILAIEPDAKAERTALWRVWLADGRSLSRTWSGPGHDDPERLRAVFAARPRSFAPLS